MERNWLIRTYQNQILGPVAKAKLLEFIEKGALGLNDEVTSGNGYWFMLKERDLVEKYLYGDIPQGYNPISESKSVLSKRDNPDKTTSINTAPANKTQVIKINNEPGILPKSDDLEFPDITVVRQNPVSASSATAEETKVPDASDLEFPDISAVSTSSMAMPQSSPAVAPKKEKVHVVEKEASALDGEVLYPKSDDLDFPDLNAVKKSNASNATMTIVAPSLKVEAEHEVPDDDRTFVVQVPKEMLGEEVKNPNTTLNSSKAMSEKVEKEAAKPAVKSSHVQKNFDGDFGDSLSLETKFHSTPASKKEKPVEKIAEKSVEKASEKLAIEDKKILHERKKASQKNKDETKEANNRDGHAMPEPLKKRNDNYIFFILIILVLIIFAVFFYFREILNKPLPV